VLAVICQSTCTRQLVTLILALFICPGSAIAQPVPGLRQPATAKDVQKAIDRTVEYLIGTQLPDGGWKEPFEFYERGVSSLVTLALLNAGEDPQSPHMSRALSYITSKALDKTYTVSLQTMAMCTANPDLYARQIERNVLWLMDRQVNDGGWDYGDGQNRSDPSNSQFALLALHEAQRVNARMPEDKRKKSFDRARSYWYRLQNADGSYNYDATPLGSMTCAGIGSLIIVGSQSDQLGASAANKIQCCGQSDENQQRLERAITWMGRNFSVDRNPGLSAGFYFYYMYGLERAGRLSGRRFFVDHQGQNRDWYREGCRMIIRQQIANGSFLGPDSHSSYSDTAFALLFLAKGKRQVVINRLDYGDRSNWNQHPMAIQHLTAHTEQAWKRDLTWQTVNLKQANVADLLEAPVLFISGSRAPNFSREEKLLLKEYVNQNGFIFAEACNGDGCNGAEFEEYFKKLVVEIFEQPLEKLPPDHPVWSAEGVIDPQDLPEGSWLYGVQSCCRLGVVYCPYSLSCRWELNLPYGNRPDYAAAVQSDLNSATKIGVNVLTYVTGKELKDKLDTVSVLEEVTKKTVTDRGLFVLPTLTHNAGADDAPRAAKNLVDWLNRENPFQMSSEKRLIGITKEQLEPYSVVFMHGRGNLELTPEQRDALRSHFQNGGTLIGDSICGDEQFTNSFRAEMELILGKPATRLDPTKHPLFSSQRFRGFDIAEVSVVEPTRGGEVTSGAIKANIHRRAPNIEAWYQDNRVCVLFSPLDLSCALESKHSLQCYGYTRDDAARLGINMILFALQQ
jgi:Domain of unknown function (DUF4159)/Prenyltransferase and squalene oxidase repeat